MDSEKHGECHLPAARRLTVSGFSALYTSRRREQCVHGTGIVNLFLTLTAVAVYFLPDAILLRPSYMMKRVFAEHSLTHGQETGEADGHQTGGGGLHFPPTRGSVSQHLCETTVSATHSPGQDRTTTSLLPCLSVSSAGPGAAGGGRPSGAARPPTLPGQQPLRLLSRGSEPQSLCVGPEHPPTSWQC